MLFIIFTDLDGTLLDENYSYKEALPVLKILRKRRVPIIFCSAKTKAEQEVIRKEMKLDHPFIVENGSAIYIPKGYFGKKVGEVRDKYEVILLGTEVGNIRKEIERLKKNYKVKGYGDMTDKEVAEITGLDLESAKLAKKREFGETLIEVEEEVLKKLKKKFNVVKGGKFIQVFGKGADKGKAVKILSDIYRDFGTITTIGIGNAQNDEKMLEVVDIPAIVKNPDGSWANLKIDKIYKAARIGPAGWVEIIKKFVLDYGDEKRI